MNDELTHLQRLQAELHEVNRTLSDAARPLERLADLNEEQRQKVAANLRDGLARWDALTQQISHVLGQLAARGS